MTAAVKPRALLELCVESGATVVIDNEDELRLLAEVAGGGVPRAASRCGSRPASARSRPPTRFGLAPARDAGAARPLLAGRRRSRRSRSAGVHFHLDGYAAADRVTALAESLGVVDALRERGHQPAFVDIGGGIPMSYLDDPAAVGAVLERAPRGAARPAASRSRSRATASA